jgi:surface antigen
MRKPNHLLLSGILVGCLSFASWSVLAQQQPTKSTASTGTYRDATGQVRPLPPGMKPPPPAGWKSTPPQTPPKSGWKASPPTTKTKPLPPAQSKPRASSEAKAEDVAQRERAVQGGHLEVKTRIIYSSDVPHRLKMNCVLFVKAELSKDGKSLPGGLITWKEKKALINPLIKSPIVGDVALINSSNHPIGHIAIVTSCDLNNRITIRETNYPRPGLYERTGTPGQLGIRGYYRPHNH